MDKTITITLTNEQCTQILGRMMSEISERCWTAGWISGAEDDLPPLIAMAAASRETQGWGQSLVWPDESDIMIALVASMGHWATLNPDINGIEYLPYQPKGGDQC